MCGLTDTFWLNYRLFKLTTLDTLAEKKAWCFFAGNKKNLLQKQANGVKQGRPVMQSWNENPQLRNI